MKTGPEKALPARRLSRQGEDMCLTLWPTSRGIQTAPVGSSLSSEKAVVWPFHLDHRWYCGIML
jgi:hypothetical protein